MYKEYFLKQIYSLIEEVKNISRRKKFKVIVCKTKIINKNLKKLLMNILNRHLLQALIQFSSILYILLSKIE